MIMPIELLSENHHDKIVDAFLHTKNQIRVISPFIQESMSKYLVDAMHRGISSQLITRFYREDFIRSVSSLSALKNLCCAGVDIYALLDLHAKLYLFDEEIAIIGSANFTGGGFGKNIELSLYIEDEHNLVYEFVQYFDQLRSDIQAAGNYCVHESMITSEMQIVQKAIKGRDHTSVPNPERFGAKIETKKPDMLPVDEVDNILNTLDPDTSAVLKFEGAAHRRLNPNEKYEPNFYKDKGFFFTSSPFAPISLTADTVVFLSAVSRNKLGAGVPIVIGRAKTIGYDSKNVADSLMLKEHPWTKDYPYYIKLNNIEIIDTEIINGISLHDLIEKIGYRLYPNSENDPTTSIPSLKARHHQKAYISITAYAAKRVNAMLDDLFLRYGKKHFA